MSFTLTPAHVDSVLSLIRSGDFMAFLDHVEPEVQWCFGASDERGKGASGVYVSHRYLLGHHEEVRVRG